MSSYVVPVQLRLGSLHLLASLGMKLQNITVIFGIRGTCQPLLSVRSGDQNDFLQVVARENNTYRYSPTNQSIVELRVLYCKV